MSATYVAGSSVLTLVLLSGKDATEAFEDVGHSDEAREFLPPLFVGEIEGGAVS